MAQRLKNANFLVSRLPLTRRSVPTDPCIEFENAIDEFLVLEEGAGTIDNDRELQEIAIANTFNQLNASCELIEVVDLNSDSSETTSESSISTDLSSSSTSGSSSSSS